MLARPLVAAAVLLTAGAGSLLLAGGTSSADGPAAAAVPAVYGPVAKVPARVASGLLAAPLVGLSPRVVVGPVVPRRSLSALPPVAVVPPGPPLGPPPGAASMGPPGVVGPDSPLHQVRAVQRLLNRGGAGLRVDGAWGPATTRAVSAVQARAGLPVDGRVGPRTLAELRRR